jgi:hypothetical protein
MPNIRDSGFFKVGASIWKPWWAKTLIIIFLFLLIIRLILSPVATYVANGYLGKKVPGYYGHVKKIRFSLYRGAYKIDSIVLNKVDSTTKQQTPFISCQLIDLSIQWKAILHKRLVGKIKVISPEVRFTKDKVEPAQVVKDTVTFRKLLNIGMPLDINRVEIENGRVRYKDETTNPKVDIAISKIDVLAQNLRNTIDSSTLLPSTIGITAEVYEGSVNVNTKLNLLKDDPTFELKAEVKGLDLTKLNNFFKAYGKFTIDRGSFSLYAEAAAIDGKYKGYLKPLIKDLKVLGPENKDEKAVTKLWEAVIGAVAFVFTNHKKDQLGTKLPFEGSVGKTQTNVVYAIFQVLRNAFIEGLTPLLDNEINITTVGKKSDNKPGFRLLKKTEGDKNGVNEKDGKKLGPIERRKQQKEEKEKQK